MPTWGDGTRWGTPRSWGYGGMPAAVLQESAVLGGQAPWLGAGHTIPWRESCAEVWSVDPDTFDLVTQLPSVGVGSARTATLVNDRYQEDVLTLVLNDPVGYLPGGIHAYLIALNALLQVVWTITSPAGTLTYPSPVYSVQSTPGRDDDVLGGSPLTVTAVDTITVVRRTPASASGYLTTDPHAPPTFDPDWFGLRFSWPPGQGPVPVAVPGTAASWQDVFDFLWPYHPFRQVFDRTGAPVVVEGGLHCTASELVLSRDPAVGGALAVPWERLTRTVRDAKFTRVEYHWIQDIPAENVTPGGVFFSDAVGIATSQSSVNPHRVTPLPHINRVFDRYVYVGTATSPFLLMGLDNYAAYLLAVELGAADTISCELDSAFPRNELGRLIRVCDLPRVDGYYQLISISQPLDVGPQTWTLSWRQDA